MSRATRLHLPLPPLVAMLVAGALANAGCVAGPSGTATCIDDTECERGDVCALGVCANPSDEALRSVAFEVEPPAGSGYPTQQFLNVEQNDTGRVRIGLRHSVRLTSRVQLADGTPIGATVAALPQSIISGRVPILSASSDPTTGAFSVDLVDQGAYRLSIVPDDPGLAPIIEGEAFIADGAGRAEMTRAAYVVPPPEVSVTITGRVVVSASEIATGVPDLEVLLKDGERRVSSLARTDATGAFVMALGGATAGLTLEVRPTIQNAFYPTVQRSEIDISGDSDLGDIDLGSVSAPVRMRGTVLGPGRDPVVQAGVYVEGNIGNGVFTAQVACDDAGAFSIDVPPGAYQVSVVAPVPGRAGTREQIGINVGPDQAAPFEIVLPARVKVQGVARDASGTPVANVALTFTRLPGTGSSARLDPLADVAWAFSTTSRDDGGYALELDPARYRVTATPPPGASLPRHSAVADFRDGGGQQDIRLKAPAVIAGLIVDDETSVPMAGVYVRAFSGLLDELHQAIPLGEGLGNDDGSFELLLPDLSTSTIQSL